LLNGQALVTVYTDQRGYFVIERLLPGEYELLANPQPNYRLNIQPPRVTPVRQSVTVTEGETQVAIKLDLAAPPGPRKEGNQ
jgi:hypothetical protein